MVQWLVLSLSEWKVVGSNPPMVCSHTVQKPSISPKLFGKCALNISLPDHNYYTYTQRAHEYDECSVWAAGRRLSCVVRSLGLRLTVRRSWVRIPAAVDFVFAMSIFHSLFQLGLGSEGKRLSPDWTQPSHLNTRKLSGCYWPKNAA